MECGRDSTRGRTEKEVPFAPSFSIGICIFHIIEDRSFHGLEASRMSPKALTCRFTAIICTMSHIRLKEAQNLAYKSGLHASFYEDSTAVL